MSAPINSTDMGPAMARQAALLVHGMTPSDQQWLLASLPAPGRAKLQGFLAELTDLGIPADPAWIDSLVGQPQMPSRMAQATNVAEANDAPQALARLGRREVVVLARLLRHEPAILSARLLGMREWPWRRALLEELGPGWRPDTEVSRGPRAPAFEAALCDELLRRLHAEAASSPSPAWRQVCSGWLRKWRHA